MTQLKEHPSPLFGILVRCSTHGHTCTLISTRTYTRACTNNYNTGFIFIHGRALLSPFTHPIPTVILLLASSRVPTAPDATIIAESGTAPNSGSTIPPMMAAGRPRSSSSSAPSGVVEQRTEKSPIVSRLARNLVCHHLCLLKQHHNEESYPQSRQRWTCQFLQTRTSLPFCSNSIKIPTYKYKFVVHCAHIDQLQTSHGISCTGTNCTNLLTVSTQTNR